MSPFESPDSRKTSRSASSEISAKRSCSGLFIKVSSSHCSHDSESGRRRSHFVPAANAAGSRNPEFNYDDTSFNASGSEINMHALPSDQADLHGDGDPRDVFALLKSLRMKTFNQLKRFNVP